MFKGDKIYLRQLKNEDATTLVLWENDVTNWHLSDTEAPFSLVEIKNYISNASNIRENRQVRFMICLVDSDKPIGAIDLFNISFKHKRAGVGILIADKENYGKGYASEAILLCLKYGQEILEIDNYFCSIQSDNLESIGLFQKLLFEQVGIRKNWYIFNGEKFDELLFQRLMNK